MVSTSTKVWTILKVWTTIFAAIDIGILFFFVFLSL